MSDYGQIRTLCYHHHSRYAARRKVFCWLPTKVYSSEWFRDGFRWLAFVWFDDVDGKHYTRQFA